jgi:hypothetical protein
MHGTEVAVLQLSLSACNDSGHIRGAQGFEESILAKRRSTQVSSIITFYTRRGRP